jgi:Raf kinase inhibitor-like YbhB/YbcL family protein
MNLERREAPSPYDFLPAVPSFEVTSADVVDGQQMPSTFTHISAGGDDLSPQLSWSGFPEATAGFAVTCFDPDAPTGSGWWHWILLDVPVSVTSLARGAGAADGEALPQGAWQLTNSYGAPAFGGAAPPPGDYPHKYFFAVHALDVSALGIDGSVSQEVAGFTLTAHTIARGLLVPTYAH